MNQACVVIEKMIIFNNFLDASDLYRVYVTSKSVFTVFTFDPIYNYVKKIIKIESAHKSSSPTLEQVLLQYELLSRLRGRNDRLDEEFITKSYALKKCLSYTSIQYDFEKMPCYYCKLLDDKFAKVLKFTQGWTQHSFNGEIVNCDTKLQLDNANFVDITQCIYEEYPGKYTCIYHDTQIDDFTICVACAYKYKFCTVNGYAESKGLQKKKFEKYIKNLLNYKSPELNIESLQEYVFRYGGYGNEKLCAPIKLLESLAKYIPRKKIYKLDGLKKKNDIRKIMKHFHEPKSGRICLQPVSGFSSGTTIFGSLINTSYIAFPPLRIASCRAVAAETVFKDNCVV